MPISINYAPQAGLLAGSALLAGQGQFAANTNQLLTSQWNTAAQLQNARLLAMQQAAAQAQLQQQQQQFELAKLPMQADLQAQSQAYQSGLGLQADLVKQAGQAYYGNQASSRDFQEAQQLSTQAAQQQANNQAAQIALQQQGELARQQQMAQYQNDLKTVGGFTDGSYQMRFQKIKQQATQDGSSYTDDQNKQIEQAYNDLGEMQDAWGGADGAGQFTLGTMAKDIRSRMQNLTNILANPGTPPPATPAERFTQSVAWFNPNAASPEEAISNKWSQGALPAQWNDKAKRWEFPVKSKDLEEGGTVGEDGRIISEKTRGLMLGNQLKERRVNLDREKHADQAVERFMKIHYMEQFLPDNSGFDPMWPQKVEAERQRAYQIYDQATQNTPSGPHPIGPQQTMQQPPPAGITGQNPQGTATAAPINGQANGQTNGYTPQMTPEVQVQIRDRLARTPRIHWTPHDYALWAQVLAARGMLQQAQ